jgi:hypothetical protein
MSKKNKVVESRNMVIDAIKKLVNDNGYDFFNKGGPREREALHLAVQPKEGDDKPLLDFVVTIGSNRFMVTFPERDVPNYCMDLNQMLDVIKDWLLNKKD